MIKYIILGIAQGLTEFLPVSSSGHLLIMQKLLGISGRELGLSIVLHLGTLTALALFFFKDILEALRDKKAIFFIIIATLITGIIGVSGKDFFESLFSSPKLVSLSLAGTGLMLLGAKGFLARAKRDVLNAKDALSFGLVQGLAIIPGISRSGATISALLFRGLKKEKAFSLSFVAAIPAILGAFFLEAGEVKSCLFLEFTNFFAGFIASLFSGLLALWGLRIVINRAKLHYFGYYCFVIAVLAWFILTP